MNRSRRGQMGSAAGKAMLLFVLWGAAAILMVLFWVKDSDLARAREEILRESSPSPEIEALATPKISRQNFEFRLPIPGEKGKYEWKVQGKESVSVDASTDEIRQFRGEMIDRGDLITLSSPIVLFNKEKRVVSSRHGALLTAPWARIEGQNMVMDMKTSDTKFSGGVTTRIDKEEAEKREGASTPPSAAKGDSETDTNEGKKPEKKKERTPLVITSDELRMYKEKNLAIFIGNVVAKDESGIIFGNRMEATNYGEEETEKDPKLKGVKTVICIGDVKIDQVEGKKQARCARAVYDAKTNIVHLYYDPETGKKVVYRDEEQKWQAEAQDMILDRNKNEVQFKGNVKTVDFNPDRKSFLGFMGPQPDKPKESKQGSESEKKPGETVE